jgi:formate-dependent nitrite reductase membrane component NrfD
MVLVLDLGRPDRLIVAMTEYNFKSIFAWNIILYNGFFAIVAVYKYKTAATNTPSKFLRRFKTTSPKGRSLHL